MYHRRNNVKCLIELGEWVPFRQCKTENAWKLQNEQ